MRRFDLLFRVDLRVGLGGDGAMRLIVLRLKKQLVASLSFPVFVFVAEDRLIASVNVVVIVGLIVRLLLVLRGLLILGLVDGEG